jgi:uncharacterized protein
MKKSIFPDLSAEPEAIKCRHCGSTQVRPSHKSSGKGTQVTTYRCQSCKRHFRVGSRLPTRQLLLGAGMLVPILLLVWFANWLMSNPADVALEDPVALHYQDALNNLEKAAKQGKPGAQYDLGQKYWQSAEYQRAFPWLKAAADQGHIEAEYLMGMAYLNGRGTLQNYRAALASFTKAAEKGHLEAEFRLGLIYRDGLATPPDKEAAYLWLNIAAAGGHEEALQLRDKLINSMSTDELHRAQDASARISEKMSTAINTNTANP